jgi:hypothetical protein
MAPTSTIHSITALRARRGPVDGPRVYMRPPEAWPFRHTAHAHFGRSRPWPGPWGLGTGDRADTVEGVI